MGSNKEKIRFELNKEFRFEAAHRLYKNYSGKCSNNHGHSWHVIVNIEGMELDESDILIDFNDLKPLKKWINEFLDHTTILWENDPMVEYIKESNQRLFITKKSPSSEHLAEVILAKAMELFNNDRIKVKYIEVKESCTSGAKVYPIS
ncbi:MAG: 6-carboxytetrahydropterin synthase [Bacteroidetes bacterium]|nr:6-carboxytetrahydropterin synthase [Bacteroidota bacterium]